nr:thioredoxin family protein [Sedimentibacter sp.]
MELLDSNEKLNGLLEKNDMVFMYFGSKDCNVCSTIKPKLEKILKKYPNIKVIQIDMNDSLLISSAYNIFTIPSIILFVDGKETIREARFINLKDLEIKISRYYKLYYV